MMKRFTSIFGEFDHPTEFRMEFDDLQEAINATRSKIADIRSEFENDRTEFVAKILGTYSELWSLFQASIIDNTNKRIVWKDGRTIK